MSTHIAALRDFPQRSALLHDLSSHMPPLPSLPLPVPFLHHSIFGLIDGNKERLQVFENELNELKKEHNNNTQRGNERSGHSASPTHVTSTVDSDHSTSGSSSSGSSPAQSSEGRHNVIVRNEHGPTVGQKRKKELVKDDAYWERRRKNNDAAKRSRDSRRQKEDEIAQRAASLEMENNALRSEVEQLRVETEQLRLLLRHQPPSLSSLKAPVAIRPSMPIGPAMGSIPHMHASLPQSVPCSLSMGGLSTPLTPLLLPAPAPAAVPNINGLMTVAPLSLGGRSVITSLSSSAPRSTVLVSAHKSE